MAQKSKFYYIIVVMYAYYIAYFTLFDNLEDGIMNSPIFIRQT